jgi:2-polyprenyl-6-methoxyphenol hydroxylase-like FAD-dependent oxidoreductase
MRNGHAVVVGAGMAGLLAARVLGESFEQVTLLDRDALPAAAVPRRGVPQARHVHAMQARGVQILDDLFPGLTDELSRAGAAPISDLSGLHFSVAGHLLCQQPKPIVPILMASRPALEHAVRSRVQVTPGVAIRSGVTVNRLLHSGAAGSAVVTGVQITSTDGTVSEERADVVVDATGRGSRTPLWLKDLGYHPPVDERIAVRVKYASQTLHFPFEREPRRFMINGRTPTRSFGVALFGGEHDTWIFTILGAHQAIPALPTRQWMLDSTAGLLPDWARAVVQAADPTGPVHTQQHPASVRRRYDRLTDFPDGLLVIGDAMCAFNPVYGQGMSIAAEQALCLRAALRVGTDKLAQRYLSAAARSTEQAWELSAGSDLAYPDVEGTPTRAMQVANRYVQRVLTVAEHNPEVARRFMAVAGLVAPKTTLFHPRVVGPVLRSAVHRSAPPGTAEPATKTVFAAQR